MVDPGLTMLAGAGMVTLISLAGPIVVDEMRARRLERGRTKRKTEPQPASQPIYWSRLDWTRVLTRTGLTEMVFRRHNPSIPFPSVRLHEAGNFTTRTVIENKMLEDFREAHKGVQFKDKRHLLNALEAWANK